VIPSLSSETLRHDVERVVANGPEAYLSPPPTDGRQFMAPRRADGIRCTRPTVPSGGVVVDVLLDREAATLVLGPVQGRSRVARVYSCVDASALHTIRVPSVP
jgi:hypothetical protein